VAVCIMSLGSLYISLCGRLSPKSFADGFWRLAFIGAIVNSVTLTRSNIGYPFNHWATLAYGVAAARPCSRFHWRFCSNLPIGRRH
jgi:hypothetical protein